MAIDSPTSEPEEPDAEHLSPELRDEQEFDGPQIEVSNQITVYNAASEIRSPLKLLGSIFSDAYQGRDLAGRLFLRNLRSMYRQTLLGLFWAFLPPIANTAIWIFLKSQKVFDMGSSPGVNDTVYILTGMILWQAFIEAFQMPLTSLNKNKNMLSKLRFPRESLLMVGLGEVFFNLSIRLLLLIPAFFMFEVTVYPSMLLGIPVIFVMILFGAAMGLIIMPIGSLYHDVGRFISMVLPFWMIITPIIYIPPTAYPATLLNWVNPASPLLIMSRDLFLLGSSDHWFAGLIFAAVAIPLFLIGLIVYRISMPVLIERMTA